MPQNLTTTTEPGAASAAPLPPPTDGDLLERFVGADDEAAFAGMVARYGPMVLQVCRSVLRSEADADDAFQAVFLQLARKASGIRRAGALPAWLHRTAQRTAVYALKRRMKYTRQTVALPAEPIAREIEAVAARQLRWTVHEQIARLSESSRTALLLYYFAGTTAREAAEQLGISEEAFKGRLRRARASLARRLATAGASVTGAAALLDGAAAQSVAGLSGAQAATGCAAVVSKSLLGGSASFTAASPSALSLAEGVSTLMFTEAIAKTAAVVAVIAAAATTGAVGVWADDQAAQVSAGGQTLVAAANTAPASEATPPVATLPALAAASEPTQPATPSLPAATRAPTATASSIPPHPAAVDTVQPQVDFAPGTEPVAQTLPSAPSQPPLAPPTPGPMVFVSPEQAGTTALPTPYLQLAADDGRSNSEELVAQLQTLIAQLAAARGRQLPLAAEQQHQAVQQAVAAQRQIAQVAQIDQEAIEQTRRELLQERNRELDRAREIAQLEAERQLEKNLEAAKAMAEAERKLQEVRAAEVVADLKAKLKDELEVRQAELQKVKLAVEDQARSAKLAAQQAHLDREMMQLEYERKMLAEQQAAFEARRKDQATIDELRARLSELEKENQNLREQLGKQTNLGGSQLNGFVGLMR